MWLWILGLACVMGGLTVIAVSVGKIIFLLGEQDQRDADLARRERLHRTGLLR